MKVIHNKNQKHTLQFENFKKKGFKYLEYSEYLNLEKKLHDMIESGQFSELSAMEIADKEYGKIKYELVTHNLQLLKKNKDLNIPIYFFYGQDDLTYYSYYKDTQKEKVKDFNYHFKFPTFEVLKLDKTVFNDKTEKLMELLKPLNQLLGGNMWVCDEVNIEMNQTHGFVKVKYGKQLSFYSPLAKFDLYHLENGSVHLGEMKSFKKGMGIGNLILSFLLFTTLQLGIPLQGLAILPDSSKGEKDNMDYHFLKKFYKKFDLEFDKGGWGKHFTSKNLIGNEKYLKDLYDTVEYFLESWITKLEEMKMLKKVS